MKTCTKCGIEKPLEEFFKDKQKKTDGHRPDCKSCNMIRSDNYRKQFKDLTNDTKYYSIIKMKYGVSKQEYKQLFTAQNGKCAICSEQADKRLCVDHCHTTNLVRGLLCTKCNLAIGNFRDDIELLQSAITYLNGRKTKE